MEVVVVYKSESLGVDAVMESGYSACDALMLEEEQVRAIHIVAFLFLFLLLPILLHRFLNNIS